VKKKEDWIVHLKFQLDGKPIEVRADSVDFSNPMLVTITGIRKELRSSVIQLPDSHTYEEFSKFDMVVVPYNWIQFAGRVAAEEVRPPIAIASIDEV
jgi:hypothetical protein